MRKLRRCLAQMTRIKGRSSILIAVTIAVCIQISSMVYFYKRALSSVKYPEEREENLRSWDTRRLQNIFNGDSRLALGQGGNAYQFRRCEKEPVFLLAMINSAPENDDRRTMIRATWGGVRLVGKLRVITVFAVGYPAHQSPSQAIIEEQRLFRDIVIGPFENRAMENSTALMLFAVKWASTVCDKARFAFLGDDRMIVRFDTLVRRLKLFTSEESTRLWYGQCVEGREPVRDPASAYYMSYDQFPGDVYPHFCTFAAGTVLSMDAVQAVNKISSSVRPNFTAPTDVYLGVLASKSHVRIETDFRFSYNELADEWCDILKVLSIQNRRSMDRLYPIWKEKDTRDFRRKCTHTSFGTGKVKNANNTKYLEETLRPLLVKPKFCFDSEGNPLKLFMIVLISTHPRSVERRRIIRKTWGARSSYGGDNVRILFVMGSAATDTKLLHDQVAKENAKHGDIIQASFLESFRNLTLKVIFGLQWVTENCAHAKYMYKGDDDMFVNFEYIIRNIKSRWPTSLTKFFIGSSMVGSPRITDNRSRYYVSADDFNGRYYPPYCSGGGYIMSTDMIPRMYELSKTIKLIPIDDAYQGMLMQKVGVRVVGSGLFKNWGGKTDTCSLRKSMVIHLGGRVGRVWHRVWRNFTDDTVTCQ